MPPVSSRKSPALLIGLASIVVRCGPFLQARRAHNRCASQWPLLPAMKTPFANRIAAGRALAQALLQLSLPGPIVVLALPRGGVPIGAEIARALHAPLGLLLVHKIGAPWQPELAVAAVVDGQPPDIVVDDETAALRISLCMVLLQEVDGGNDGDAGLRLPSRAA